MVHEGKRCEQGSVSIFPASKTKIDVAVGIGSVIFVESSYILPDRFTKCHTGSCNGTVISNEKGSVDIAVIGFVDEFERLATDSSYAKYDACVLNMIVRIQQFCPNWSNFGANSLHNQLLKPFWVDDSCIIVEEANDIFVSRTDCCVVNARIVELPGSFENFNSS
jgi:hypothetical protein